MATGVSYMLFAVTVEIHQAAFAAFLCGVFIIMSIGGSNVIIQTLVEERMRGRVMSLYGLALVGISPFGSIIAGAAAVRSGPMPALFFVGISGAAAMLWFWFRLPRFRSHVRPIYVKKVLFLIFRS